MSNSLKVAGAVVGLALAVGVAVFGLSSGDSTKPAGAPDKPAQVATEAGDTSAPPPPVPAPVHKHSICYNTATGQIVAVVWAGHVWGPGENRPPLATADVDMPPSFRVDDLPLHRWIYIDGKVQRVKGDEPPLPLTMPPEVQP